MKIALLALAGLLAGCNTLVQRVEVPVAVPCRVTVPPEPVWATSGLTPADGPWRQVTALLAERRQRIGYEGQLLAALEACGGSLQVAS